MVLAASSAVEGQSADLGKVSANTPVDWTGPFVGRHFAYASGHSNFSLVGPGVPHEAAPLGPARFQMEFHRAPGTPIPWSRGHQRPARSALPITASEDVAITTAAPSGVTRPATAAGTATKL